MIEKHITDCAKWLFDKLKEDYPEHNDIWYIYDDIKAERYYKDFEKALLSCLKTRWKILTREDLEKVAICFDELARKEKFGLFFPKSLFETVNNLGIKFSDQESVNDLCRFIACSLKVKDSNSAIIQINGYKKNFLSLSFDSESNPFTTIVDPFEIGKGESLIRELKKKLNFNHYTITLFYENEIKKIMNEKEFRHVTWIHKITDLDVLQSPKYDSIILTNPFLYNPIISFNDEKTDYIVEGVRDYNPLSETLSQYGKLLKNNGKMFLVAEYLAVDNKFLYHLQSESKVNNLYVETIANFYTIDKELDASVRKYYNNISSKFLLIVLGKGKNNTEKIKFLNIDNLMEDLLIKKLIDMRYGDSIIDNDYVEFISCGPDFDNEADYHDLTDRLYYTILEKVFVFNYEKKHYIEIAKRLYDEEYKRELKESFSDGANSKGNNIRAQLNGMAQISETLGLYYGGSQDLEILNKAKKYLEIAKWCGKETDDYLKRVLDKITALNSGENPFIKFKMNFNDLYPFDATRNIQSELVDKTETMLCNEFEERHWNKLQKETKIYLSTAVFTIIQYLSVGEKLYTRFDYSGVISLLMRALEYESGIRFGREYIKFLQEKYPNVQDFLEENKIKRIKDRSAVVHKNDDRCYYCTYYGTEKEGNKNYYFKTMQLLMGYADTVDNGKMLISVDSTFMEYIKAKTINERDKDNQKILAWIRNIVSEVKYLEKIRNDASHGGRVLNINTLIDAFNTLILVKKVLKELVAPF